MQSSSYLVRRLRFMLSISATSLALAWGPTLAVAVPSKQPSFMGLGDLPGGRVLGHANGVSGDGSTVVGSSESNINIQPFIWTEATGMRALWSPTGGSYIGGADDISEDGQFVVGNNAIATTPRPYRWTAQGGMQYLGGNPPGGPYASASYPHAVSAHGDVVAGDSLSDSGYEGFRWTSSSGFSGVGDLPGGGFYSDAYGLSADGTVIVGASLSSPTQREAYRWEAGVLRGLGYLLSGPQSSQAYDASSDGSVVVGYSGDSAYGIGEAFRWTQTAGMVGLGVLRPGSTWSLAYGVSGDGTRIVGFSQSALFGNEPFLWDASDGLINLVELLRDKFGLNLNGWRGLIATDISADGTTIVGYGYDPSGGTQAWRAVIPEPATFAIFAACALAAIRRSRRDGCGRDRMRFNNTRPR